VASFSDDFNARNINKRVWTINDLIGDATFTTYGTGTANARSPLVSAGVTHDLFTQRNTVPGFCSRQQIQISHFR
jgi:hypothetical protein